MHLVLHENTNLAERVTLTRRRFGVHARAQHAPKPSLGMTFIATGRPLHSITAKSLPQPHRLFVEIQDESRPHNMELQGVTRSHQRPMVDGSADLWQPRRITILARIQQVDNSRP